jgi:N-acetylmuramic acid 6-phosphate etherase
MKQTPLTALQTEARNPRTAQLSAMKTGALLRAINREDRTVARAVAHVIPVLTSLVDQAALRLNAGGRLLYVGAGTSGRLGCLDASEIPPTYGVPARLVQGIVAGGARALRRSIEGAEDDGPAGVAAMARQRVSSRDVVVGLSASGRARYVRAALAEARRRGALTAGITCNRNSLLAECVDVALVAETGPEAVAGSTRMKAGTAQKMILNMLSTALMVRLGRVQGNHMTHLQIKCEKLRERAALLVMSEAGVSRTKALLFLKKSGGSVHAAIQAAKSTHAARVSVR